MARGVFTEDGRAPRRLETGACGDLQALAPTLVRWEEIAQSIESSLPKINGGNWYAPASTARMIRSYFVRRWCGQDADHGKRAVAAARFDFFFEHYQLREIALAQIERQLQAFGIALEPDRLRGGAQDIQRRRSLAADSSPGC